MALQDVLITDQLADRKSRGLDIFSERRSLNTIARRMDYGREGIFDALCQMAIEFCRADSSGISVLHETGEPGFSWDAMAGDLADMVGGRAPRHHSPCGVCLELGDTQLFSHPERHFEWMLAAKLPIVEGLVIPMYLEGRVPYGTIWVMHHQEGHAFDQEDVRIMTALGNHASAAIQMQINRANR